MFVLVQAEALPLPARFYKFSHVLCVLRALQRTQNTQNMYYSVGSPTVTHLYESIALRGKLSWQPLRSRSIVVAGLAPAM